MQTFGEWLYQQRKAKDLTQGELAERSGLSKSYVSTLERGAKHSTTGADLQPSREAVNALAHGLGISVNTILQAAGYLPDTLTIEIQYPEDAPRPAIDDALREEIRTALESLMRINERLNAK